MTEKTRNIASIAWLPILLAVIATMSWAGNITLSKMVNATIPPIGLAFWRWTVASLVLAPFVIRPMRRQWPLFKRHIKLVLLLALFGVAGYNTLVYIALENTLSTNVVILQSSSPLMILLVQFLLFRHTTTYRQALAICVSAIGVLLIITKGQLVTDFSLGNSEMIALFAILVWATYSVLVQKLPADLKGLPMLGYTVFIGNLMLLPFYLGESLLFETMPISKESIAISLYTGIFASGIAFFCWNAAVQRMGAATTGQFMHLIPVFGLIFSMLLLGEKLLQYHYLGIAFIVAGIVIANIKPAVKADSAPQNRY
ncbi:DMT family transporter [Enterovibrio paralichthyis]|uniref:DMT family transporter n=1 Tax=Enterovibrio paralichthyis TaxID=2853805 RepID=UPI001C458C9B|nr:DMT family transporter [Enterovibrio paralichthyis]MBV7298024.1 DMT family transporter [Enterovibrio paralichthyis]